jgi:membrane protein YdbS with pleckstrin-like domain
MGIRVVPNETVPAAVYRVLLPHERRVITVRFHPAILIRPVAEALGGLAVAGLLSTLLHLYSTVLLVVWLLWLILVIRLLFRIYAWLEDYFVVTSARLLLATGVFKKTVNMMPLSKVTDMRFERSPSGRLFGFGTFIVESAGQEQALHTIDHLPYPEQLYIEVCGLIFKDPGTGDD